MNPYIDAMSEIAMAKEASWGPSVMEQMAAEKVAMWKEAAMPPTSVWNAVKGAGRGVSAALGTGMRAVGKQVGEGHVGDALNWAGTQFQKNPGRAMGALGAAGVLGAGAIGAGAGALGAAGGAATMAPVAGGAGYMAGRR